MLQKECSLRAIAGCIGLAIVFSITPCHAQSQRSPIRTGFELAKSRKQLLQGSDYFNLVDRAVRLVERGYSPDVASRFTGVKIPVLLKLIEMGERSIPMVKASLPVRSKRQIVKGDKGLLSPPTIPRRVVKSRFPKKPQSKKAQSMTQAKRAIIALKAKEPSQLANSFEAEIKEAVEVAAQLSIEEQIAPDEKQYFPMETDAIVRETFKSVPKYKLKGARLVQYQMLYLNLEYDRARR
jgi:hypothetical protein